MFFRSKIASIWARSESTLAPAAAKSFNTLADAIAGGASNAERGIVCPHLSLWTHAVIPCMNPAASRAACDSLATFASSVGYSFSIAGITT